MAEKALGQKDLANIYKAQQEGRWDVVQEKQLDMKAALVKNYELNWQQYHKEHPEIKPVFDLPNQNEQLISIDKDLAEQYNLLGHLAEFDKKSDNSTAGIRAFYDILHSENPSMMYNDLFMALLIDAEADFLWEVHKEIKKSVSKIKKQFGSVQGFVKDLQTKISQADIEIIEAIYQMPLLDLIEFLENNMVKLVSGEVRAHTAKFVELEARILAARGVTVLAAPDYHNTIPIYMHSFLAFLLGATGATNYTPSHSSNYLFGRKVLAIGGGQLLPDKYEVYRVTLRQIIEGKIINGSGHTIKIASGKDKHIKRTLTYERMTALYSSILNVTPTDVAQINAASDAGHRIILNSLNGSTWRTLAPLLDRLGIKKEVFEHIYVNEDPFFDIGYIVTSSKDRDGNVSYAIDHLGTDVSMSKVAQTIPYAKLLKTAPIGLKLYECDADSDRYCVKQVVENNTENKKLVEAFGIDNYKLDEKRMLIALSPNKMFLLLDVADYERMVEQGIWDKYYSLYLITYVSTRAWAEFADAILGMKKVVTRVGYKNLTEMQQLVEKWYFSDAEKQTFHFVDQVGNSIELDRKREIRIHCKSEESGGRVAGMNNECFNILGVRSLAMPEKSDPDSLLSELTLSSKLYLERGKSDGEYRLLAMLQRVFDKYGLKSKIDARFDIMHGDQGSIALMPYKKQQAALASAGAMKANFNNFFFSLGKAVRDKKIDISAVKQIMSKLVPALHDTWQCIESITLCDEPLSGGRVRPEGVPMTFLAANGHQPLVTELDFRPSGTDPLKSKVYIDAETLTAETKKLLESTFDTMTGYDLYDVLQHFGIESIEKRTAAVDGLKRYKL